MAVSIVLLVLGLRPPELVMRFASQISGSVTPLALIYCGYIVYEVGLKNLRFLQGMPTMLVIRLIVSPLICAAFCLLGACPAWPCGCSSWSPPCLWSARSR